MTVGLRGAATVATAVMILFALPAASAVASCAMAPPIEEHLRLADAVFVGTVHQVTNENRTATVEIHEIWTGPDLPASVVVHGGQEEMTTSGDRLFEAGIRYLFAVATHDGRLEDNGCSATQPWTDQLIELRPEEPRLPMASPEADGGVPAPLIVALAGAAIVTLTGLLAFRRRT